MKDARPTSVKRLWRFSDEGIKHMSNLHILCAYKNEKITDEGIKHLKNCEIYR